MVKYYLIAIFSGILSSFSQILLKKSAQDQKAVLWKEYLNPFVAGGYVMMIACMLLTVVAYRGIPFKYGAVLEALVYLYIMVLSRVFLKEKLTGKKILGNVMIGAGVIIFSLGK